MAPAIHLISRSGQMSRLLLGFGLIVVSGVLMTVAGYLIDILAPEHFASLTVVGCLLGISGFAYLCIRIRCPGCNAKWIWLMASKRRENPDHWSLRSGHCTNCGYAGDSAS